MRCLVACCFGLSLLIAVGGCRSCERVETELRAREDEVQQLRAELDRCGVYNQTLQQEVHTLRGQLGVPPIGPPAAAYPVQKLELGRQTGGRSNYNCPGDDALQVVVSPLDPEGKGIKAPGQLLINAQEITPEGLKRPLSTWLIPPEQLRKSWTNGLLTTGYVLNLPWKVWPATEKLRVSVEFQLTDGRLFAADRDVTVRLTPVNQRPTITPDNTSTPSSSPTSKPGEDGGPMLLPPPKRIDPVQPAPAELPTGPQLSSTPKLASPDDILPGPVSAEFLRPVPLKPDAQDP
jgi:hypothetical protein